MRTYIAVWGHIHIITAICVCSALLYAGTGLLLSRSGLMRWTGVCVCSNLATRHYFPTFRTHTHTPVTHYQTSFRYLKHSRMCCKFYVADISRAHTHARTHTHTHTHTHTLTHGNKRTCKYYYLTLSLAFSVCLSVCLSLSLLYVHIIHTQTHTHTKSYLYSLEKL